MRNERQRGNIFTGLINEEARLHRIIEKREKIYTLVGTGEVSPFSNVVSAKKVGEVKRGLDNNIKEKKAEHETVLSNLEIYKDAQERISTLRESRAELNEIRDLVKEGHLSTDVLKHHKIQYTKLGKDLREDPGVGEMMDHLIMEERSENREFILPGGEITRGAGAQVMNIAAEGTVENPIPINTFLDKIYSGVEFKDANLRFTNAKTRVKGLLVDTDLELRYVRIENDQKGESGYYLHGLVEPSILEEDPIDSFRLTEDKQISGKKAQLLKLVSRGSIEAPIEATNLIQELYPNIDLKIAKTRFAALRADARESLIGSGLELIYFKKYESRSGKAGYILADWETSFEVNLSRSSSMKMVDVKQVVSEQGINEVGSTLRTLRASFADQGKRINYYPNRKKLDACYLDQRREPVNIGLIERRLIVQDKMLELSDDQTKVFGTLMRLRRTHVGYDKILNREFPEMSRTEGVAKVNRILLELEGIFEDALGIDDVTTKGLDTNSNPWVKLKDVKRGVYACEGLADNDLCILTQTFSDDFPKVNIFNSFGTTSKGIPYTWHQARLSIVGKCISLEGRVNAGVANEGESELFKKIKTCLRRNGHDTYNNNSLMKFLEKRLKDDTPQVN